MDLGLVRTGLAVSDPSGFLASPVATITERSADRLLEKVAQAVQEQGAEEIVVGHPRNMDGSRGESARRAEDFAAALERRTGLPVKLWDERGTTVSATRYLNETDTKGQKRKDVIDEVAATIILESYLNYRRNHPEEV